MKPKAEDHDLIFQLESFFDYLKAVKRSSENTRMAYQNDLLQYAAYLSVKFSCDRPLLSHFTSQTVRAFLSSLVREGYSSTSVARKLAAIRGFARHLILQDLMKTNPAQNIATPKIEKKLPRFLARKEIVALLSLPDRNSFEGLRDSLMLKLFYGTGLRVSELVSLRRCDVDNYQNTLRITGKGNKTRIVPLGVDLAKELAEYFDAAQKHFNTRLELNDYIFVKENKEPFNRLQIGTIVRSYVKKVASGEKAHPHALRHTFATHLLNEGADLMSVKELMGHSSLSSTQIYTHVSAEHLRKIYRQAHPRAEE